MIRYPKEKEQTKDDNQEKDQQAAWEYYSFNISADSAFFLWEKMLHLFEKVDAPKSENQRRQTIHNAEAVSTVLTDPNNYCLYLKAYDEAIHEIIFIGRHMREKKKEGASEPATLITITDSFHFKSDKDHSDSTPGSNSDRKLRRFGDEEIRRIDTKTIEKTTESFMKQPVAKQKSNLVIDADRIASGQAILSLFGKWLFEAINIDNAGYQRVCGAGLSILAKVFTYARGPFKDEQIRQFYLGLKAYFSRALEDKNDVHQLIRSCRRLFCNSNVADNLLLQKLLLENIHKYCIKSKQDELNIEIKKAYNKIIQSVICRQQDIINAKKSLNDDMFYYKDFKTLVVDAFSREKEYIKQKLGITPMPNANPNMNPATKLVPKQDTTDSVTIFLSSTWNLLFACLLDAKVYEFLHNFVSGLDPTTGMMPFVYEVLLTTAELCMIKISDHPLNPDVIDDVSRSASTALNFLCNGALEVKMKSLVEFLSRTGNQKNLDTGAVITEVINGLAAVYVWILCSQKFNHIDIDQRKFSKRNPTKEALGIKLLLYATENQVIPISQTAKTMIANLCNSFGRINLSKNIPFQGSVLIQDPSKKYGAKTNLDEHIICHLAINDDLIITFFDFEFSKLHEDLMVVIRHPLGKFYWYGESYYKLQTVPDNNANSEVFNHNFDEQNSKASEDNPSMMEAHELSPKFNSKDYQSDQDFDEMVDAQIRLETELKKYTPHEEFKTKQLNDTSTSSQFYSRYLKVKSFLLNFGLFDFHNMKHIKLLNPDESIRESFLKLDRLTERARILINVIYCESPYSYSYQNFNVKDKTFEMFLDSLGMLINEESLAQGTCDTLRAEIEQHKELIYFSTPIYELLFCSPDEKRAQEETMHTISDIHIVWNARKNDKYDDKTPIIINKLDITDQRCAIIITPLRLNYFRIILADNFTKEKRGQIFPQTLVDGFEVNKELLPTVLCQIIISIYRVTKTQPSENMYYKELVFGNQWNREKVINELIATRDEKTKWQTIADLLQIK